MYERGRGLNQTGANSGEDGGPVGMDAEEGTGALISEEDQAQMVNHPLELSYHLGSTDYSAKILGHDTLNANRCLKCCRFPAQILMLRADVFAET